MHHRAQGLGVALRIGGGQQQVGRQRQRGGARHAGAHAARQRQRIGMGDLLVVQQGQRLVGLARPARGGPGFERQRGQVQGDPEWGGWGGYARACLSSGLACGAGSRRAA